MYLPASSLAQLDFSLPCRFSSGDVQSYQLWIYGEQQDSLLSTKLPTERLKFGALQALPDAAQSAKDGVGASSSTGA